MQNSAAMEGEIKGIQVTDVSGQRRFSLSALTGDITITEMLQSIVAKMGLPRNDHSGRPLVYRARLHREGRHLDGREVVGRALRENDEVQLHPTVDAGGGQ